MSEETNNQPTAQQSGGQASPSLDCSASRVLRLTLKRKWFEMIASGEKTEEYREPKPWIFSRLANREYDRIEFSNGYGANVPKIEVEYLGWELRFGGRAEWGAAPQQRYVVIHLGRVIRSQNG